MNTEMAERVKFWEEQQRINAVLVPRVVEGAKTVETLAQQVTALSDRLHALEAQQRRVRGGRSVALVALGLSILSLGLGGAALAASLGML